MILYHGSIDFVECPEIRRGDNFLDFGVGFYTTTSYEQAKRWAKNKMRRHNVETGYVSFYTFDLDTAKLELEMKNFEQADEEWLTFVVNNRAGNDKKEGVDMHIGPVADDNVYQTIRLFETGAYDAEYTVKKLKTETLRDQWTFHTDKSLLFLEFIDFKTVKQGE